jgi:hypothetical protein
LWDFLNQPDTLLRLDTATALDRPAVEAIEEPLLEKFGAKVLEDRIKQMIGHMVRQIMERRGYVIGVQNTKITNGAPFSRATKYRLPDDMVFHVFRSTTAARTLALTGDKAGARLPVDNPLPGTKWTYWKSFRGGLRGRIAFGLENQKQARAEIAQNGYFIYEMPRLLKAM